MGSSDADVVRPAVVPDGHGSGLVDGVALIVALHPQAQERQGGQHSAVGLLVVGQAELGEDALAVHLDRALRESEASGDTGVGETFGDQAEHLDLAWRQGVEDAGASDGAVTQFRC